MELVTFTPVCGAGVAWCLNVADMGGAASTSSPNPHYTLPNDWELADERLAMLGAAYDPESIDLALRLGVGPGSRCLEVGAGGGSFARWLCQTALPTGRVVAVDADTRHLDGLSDRGGEIAQIDLVTGSLPEGEFDFVHTRFVLLHIAQRDEILQRLIGALAPGGVVVLEEGDGLGVTEGMSGAFGQVWRAFSRSTEVAGADQSWARNIPAKLQSFGLVNIQAKTEIPTFRGNSPLAKMWQLTWDQVRGTLVTLGVPDEMITAAQAELQDDQRWFYAPPTVRAWARAPE
ncbi:type 11 methyltransferase [Mycobacteroides abscessus subsp. abscessus]|nr:type 11 methyltransferase [Mycobacteroides abscessus subsp. abscessus]SLJ11881.1 type 11 methyltransferase [Mycobacteroides abscessus subsp. abscessus]SLJ81010.1 type 11 methyltransferase [Mycobacteroides abscessus subsp. abscessus]